MKDNIYDSRTPLTVPDELCKIFAGVSITDKLINRDNEQHCIEGKYKYPIINTRSLRIYKEAKSEDELNNLILPTAKEYNLKVIDLITTQINNLQKAKDYLVRENLIIDREFQKDLEPTLFDQQEKEVVNA